MLVQQVEPQLIRPPVAIRRAAASGVMERTPGFGRHGPAIRGLG
jgi:hypothetical protein